MRHVLCSLHCACRALRCWVLLLQAMNQHSMAGFVIAGLLAPSSARHLQAHFRTSRGAQHIVSPDLARAYYGPCAAPPAPCARPRAFNLDTDLFNVTPYYRFKANYLYKGRDSWQIVSRPLC